MPRNLGDVLHYFMPEAAVSAPAPRAMLPILAVPLGESDVLRAAFLWNLAVEVARLGPVATVLAPAEGNLSHLWPDPGRGPVGTELVFSFAQDLAELSRAACDLAASRAEGTAEGGLVLVRIPPRWLAKAGAAATLLQRTLLFTSPDRRDLLETYVLAKRVLELAPAANLGVTIHGVRRVADAEAAFRRLAGAVERQLDAPLLSYGLLVDDLHVYRAIVSRRPIGLAHPQSPAARTLRDVARLLLLDARGAAADPQEAAALG